VKFFPDAPSRASRKKTLREVWFSRAKGTDPDHPKWPLDPTAAGDPVPAIREAIKQGSSQDVDKHRLIDLSLNDFNLHLYYWSFPLKQYQVRIRKSPDQHGRDVTYFREKENALLAVNGGFFDQLDGAMVVSTGLVVINGMVDPGHQPAKGGSGVLYESSGQWGIVSIEEFSRLSNVQYALQNGPRLVERGRIQGVKSDNGSVTARTAICLHDDEFGLLVVDGPITLLQQSILMSTPSAQGGLGCDIALNLDGGPSVQADYLSEKNGWK
jgi:hypothetical protein